MIERPRSFRKFGLGYVYEPVTAEGEALGVSLKVDTLHRRGDYIYGEILVEATLPGLPSHIVQSTQNFTSADTRQKFAKLLATRTAGVSLDWAGIIEAFCIGVLRAEREGAPFQRVGDLPDVRDPPDLVQHLVQDGRLNDIHGPGGDGKGWLATFIAACVQTGTNLAHLRVAAPGNVLYLDWEDDARTLNKRLRAASRGLGLPPVVIDYRQCHGSLREQVLQIARHVSSLHVSMIVVDSVELASGTISEHGAYQERAEGLFEALRAVQTGVDWPLSVLLIDHVSDEGRRSERGATKSYGSVFKTNWVRNSWELRKDQEPGSPRAYIGLYQFKANHSSRVPPIGLELDFSAWPDSVIARGIEVSEHGELSKRLTNATRLLAVMGANALRDPKSVADLSDATGIAANTIRAELARLKQSKRVVQTTDGRWLKTTPDTTLPGMSSSPEEPPDWEEQISF